MDECKPLDGGDDGDGIDEAPVPANTKSAGVPIPASAYLDSLCPITAEQLYGGGGGELGVGAAEGNGLSKAQLEGLPLDRRIHALFAHGRAVQVQPMKPMLKAPVTQRLKQRHDELLTILLQFCFKFQLAPLQHGQRTVLRFARIMHFAPAGSTPEEVVAALLTVAHLVQGRAVQVDSIKTRVERAHGFSA